MKCPNCGEDLDNNSGFCAKCGSAIERGSRAGKSSANSDASKIIDAVLSKPKLIVAILLVIILIFALLLITSGGDSFNQEYSKDNCYQMTVGGILFNVPNGFEESYHSGPFKDGSETIDFKSNDYDDLEICVSPKYKADLNSNHVKVKTSKNIGGMDGTLVFYDSNRVSFYYNYGDYTVKLNSNSPDYNDLFNAVLS